MSMVIGAADGSILEAQTHNWQLLLLLTDGSEYVLDQWNSFSFGQTLDEMTLTVEVNGLDPALAYIRELVTDIRLSCDGTLMHRFRVVDTEDNLTREGHTVTLDCVTYKKLLDRRVLHENWVLVDQDTDAAWRLIEYTQAFETLGITRGQVAGIGPRRQRSLDAGDTILQAINDFAEAENGFDWAIDGNLVFWVFKPRKGVVHDIEWRWGDEIAEVVRSSPAEDYASWLMVTGAQNETKIPNPPGPDIVYPPPPPQIVEITPKPLGLWESSVSYSDVVTVESLAEKAAWHISQRGNIRPTYTLTMEYGIWQPIHRIGDVIPIRIQAPPRLDIRVPVRIEEIEINCDANGAEEVTMSVRAEEPETFVTPSPIGPWPIAPSTLAGRSVAVRRLHPQDDLGVLLRSFDARLGRQERSPGA